jgi:preprotein translocase subunit SecY
MEANMAVLKSQITPTQARQGSPRRMNLRVLTGSLLLALVAAAVLYTAFFYQSSVTIPVTQQQQPK